MITKKDIKDKLGWTIRKGTEITIIETLTNPITKRKEHIISIDNGTGIKDLEPKTVIQADELEG